MDISKDRNLERISWGARLDTFRTQHTESLHIIERYRLVDYDTATAAQARSVEEYGSPQTTQAAVIDQTYRGGGLQVAFTVEDSNFFTEPWSGTATYRKASVAW